MRLFLCFSAWERTAGTSSARWPQATTSASHSAARVLACPRMSHGHTSLPAAASMSSTLEPGQKPVSRLCNESLRHEPSPSWSSFHYRSEEHTSELQSLRHLVCRLL